jgi:acetolactate synthase-1/2/3 large subunit
MTHQPTHATLLPSAANVIVRQLAACGIDYVFANGGTDFPPIVEAYAQAQERGEDFPQPMVIPHENAAVAMAHGVYLATGRPQAVMVHVNVGTANALNGLLNASRENIPMLVMAGRSPYSEHGYLGTRTRYIHWAQEMFDQAGMVREAVKWDYELHLPDQAADCVVRAHEVAMTTPRGPTYLTLPRDTLAAPSRIDASPPRRAVAASALPEQDAVATATEWLAAAARPVIVTANAGRSAQGFSALAELAEQFAIPVASFHPRFANLPSSHPMHAGYQPGPYVQEADVIVVVDCDVPWIPSLHQPRPDCHVIHIGEQPGFTRYPMRSFPVDLSIAGDTPKVLQAICAQAGEMKSARLEARRATLAARLREQRQGWEAKAAPRDGAITPEYISHCVAQAVGEEAVIVNEYPLRLEQCPRERPGTYFGLSPAGGLGWGLGAALGIKLAAPEKLVVATLGDGAYIFANPTACHWVARAHNLPILTIVFNNQLHGAVRNGTMAMYGQGAAARAGGRMLADLRPSPDFEMVVAASGGHGERVEAASELPAALARAVRIVREEKRQALVNILCDY